MKRLFFVLLIPILLIQILSAQPKVAILDAAVGGGVHLNAAAIVADTINEQFVKSPDYTAIDRAYISNIQAEKQFQLSGEVNDADIKELGITFGADYLCIANVSLLGATYTVSARLIKVETAEVVSQESARSQGTIDILFDVAEEVGRKLVGASLTAAPKTAKPAAAQPAPAPAPAAAAAPARTQKPRVKSHATFSYMIPGYMEGEEYYIAADELAYSYFIDVSETSHASWGLDGHLLFPFAKLFYLSTGAAYTVQEVYATDIYGSSYYWENFSTAEIYAGAGVIYPVTKRIQVYGGMTIGYLLFTLGSDYGDNAVDPLWAYLATGQYPPGSEASGMSLGFEIGADYTLGPLCLSLRYKFSHSSYLEGDDIFTVYESDVLGLDNSFGVQGLVIGAGLAW